MICEICKKNQATIHIQELIHGKKKAVHICGECAEKKGLGDVGLPPGINLAELLYKISANMNTDDTETQQPQGEVKPGETENVGDIPTTVCPKCQWDIKRFKETGRLGCDACYDTFKDILTEALKNMHRGTTHLGKSPRSGKTKTVEVGARNIAAEISILQRRLEDHVRKEEFEKAAELRDKINALKAKAEPSSK